MKRLLILTAIFILCSMNAWAGLKLPAIFGDNMVLQEKLDNPVWGWDTPGTKITVSIAGLTRSTVAGADGKWMVRLDLMPASDAPLKLTVKGSKTIEFKNVQVGEVWLCSGQSNMELPLKDTQNGEAEAASMNDPGMRLIKVPVLASQDPQIDFKGAWASCTPESSRDFSALAVFYGRILRQKLKVPVGLICVAAGGSTIQTWMDRGALEMDPQFKEMILRDSRSVQHATDPLRLAEFDAEVSAYQKAMDEWKAAHEKNPGTEVPPPVRPRDPREYLTGRQRIGNFYQGMLRPVIGYGIKGVIWYQGEANTKAAWAYAREFPALIRQWRGVWNQGDFPFYWVQLPGFHARTESPVDSEWAELRESQTLTMELPHTGQAVIIDLGDAENIHPKNKLDVADRLARWPLVQEHGLSMPYRSPEFKGGAIIGKKMKVTFDFAGSGLCTNPGTEVKGFAVCGKDRQWFWAQGEITGNDTVTVWSEKVRAPVAVRYGWADNPECTLFNKDGLPVNPFRTDGFDLVTGPGGNTAGHAP